MAYKVKLVTDILGVTPKQTKEEKVFTTENDAKAYFAEERAKAIANYETWRNTSFPKRIIKDEPNKLVIDDRVSVHFVHLTIRQIP